MWYCFYRRRNRPLDLHDCWQDLKSTPRLLEEQNFPKVFVSSREIVRSNPAASPARKRGSLAATHVVCLATQVSLVNPRTADRRWHSGVHVVAGRSRCFAIWQKNTKSSEFPIHYFSYPLNTEIWNPAVIVTVFVYLFLSLGVRDWVSVTCVIYKENQDYNADSVFSHVVYRHYKLETAIFPSLAQCRPTDLSHHLLMPQFSLQWCYYYYILTECPWQRYHLKWKSWAQPLISLRWWKASKTNGMTMQAIHWLPGYKPIIFVRGK